MVYIQGLAEQTQIFLYALGFGFILGILYDFFRTIRLIISHARGFVFFMDLLYFAICAFLTFCFVLVADGGKVRVYVALGEFLGWMIYYFSFGSIALKVTNGIVRGTEAFFEALFKPIERILTKINRSNRKIIRKSYKKVKFVLQKRNGIVYNLYCYIINSVFGKRKKKNDCIQNSK